MDYRDDRVRTGGRDRALDNPKDTGGFVHGLGVLAGHVIQKKVEATYARSDLFERRRRLMNDWPSVVCPAQGILYE